MDKLGKEIRHYFEEVLLEDQLFLYSAQFIYCIIFTGGLLFLNSFLLKHSANILGDDRHHMKKVFATILVSLFSFLLFKQIQSKCLVFIFIIGFSCLNILYNEERMYEKAKERIYANGLDYGSGMAYSFFHGYLSIILPDRGDANKGIKEMMTDYENRHRIKFMKKKLYILASNTLYCPPNLRDASGKNGGPSMEEAETLGEVTRNRAGVIDRKYKNSVYKIVKDRHSAPIYVVAEGATPLLTLHNSLKSTSKHCEIYIKHKAEIAKMFYQTLVHLVETNEECKDLCEVVYYDNENDNVNIAELLLERIMKRETSEK